MDPVFVRLERLVLGTSTSESKGKELSSEKQEVEPEPRISLLTYALAQFLPLTLSASSLFTSLEVFVPLTGRIGADAPADNLIATIVTSLGALAFPLFVPFVWRFQNDLSANVQPSGEKKTQTQNGVLKTMILIMALITAVPIAIFSAREPFDSMHQKRVYVMRTENVSCLSPLETYIRSVRCIFYRSLINRAAM